MSFSRNVVLIGLITALFTSTAGYSQEEMQVLEAVKAQLPMAANLKSREDLATFFEANIENLDVETRSALEKLAKSNSTLAKQILNAHSLDLKLGQFKQDLTALENVRFNQITGFPSKVKLPKDQIVNVNHSLSTKLEALQQKLSEGEVDELVSRLTRFGHVKQSTFGVDD